MGILNVSKESIGPENLAQYTECRLFGRVPAGCHIPYSCSELKTATIKIFFNG